MSLNSCSNNLCYSPSYLHYIVPYFPLLSFPHLYLPPLPFSPETPRTAFSFFLLSHPPPLSTFTMLLPFTNRGLLFPRGDRSRSRSCLDKEPFRSLPAFSLPVTDLLPCSIKEVEILRGVGVTEFLLGGTPLALRLGLVSTNLLVVMNCM